MTHHHTGPSHHSLAWKRRLVLWCVVAFSALLPHALQADQQPQGKMKKQQRKEMSNLTSELMQKVFCYTGKNNIQLDNLLLDTYVKFQMHTKRRSVLVRYLPGMFKVERGDHYYLGESQLSYHYHTQGLVDHREIARFSTMPHLRQWRERTMGQFTMSIYEDNLFNSRILSPLYYKNRHLYKYRADFSHAEDGRQLYRIQIRPTISNSQLVRGFIDVDVRTGAVVFFSFSLKYDLTRLNLSGEMGKDSLQSALPARMDIMADVGFLGSKIDMRYEVTNKVSPALHTDTSTTSDTGNRFDLTKRAFLRTDTVSVINSLSYFNRVRPDSLSEQEKRIYREYLDMQEKKKSKSKADTTDNDIQRSVTVRVKYKKFEDIALDSHTLSLGKKGKLKIPALITPSMVEWSHSRGFRIQTRLWLKLDMPNEAYLTASPRIGYNFKQERIYWKVPIEWYFHPPTDGTIRVEAGNGNLLYNIWPAENARKRLEESGNTDLLEEFNKYDFNYYSDVYFRMSASFEPIKGLCVESGLRFHTRFLQNRNSTAEAAGMPETYQTLAPRVHLVWTPRTYYYRQGRRRISLTSRYPTFMLDYERGISIDRTASKYERWEADMRYRIPLHALRAFTLRVGGGLYTHKKNSYFIDFDNFCDHNMPTGWEDELTGQFQTLPSHWYNESSNYFRLSNAYESPMLLLARIPHIGRFLHRERIYVSYLKVPHLNFCELGYGFSTQVFDAGVFVSFADHENTSVGAKIAFRILDD